MLKEIYKTLKVSYKGDEVISLFIIAEILTELELKDLCTKLPYCVLNYVIKYQNLLHLERVKF